MNGRRRDQSNDNDRSDRVDRPIREDRGGQRIERKEGRQDVTDWDPPPRRDKDDKRK